MSTLKVLPIHFWMKLSRHKQFQNRREHTLSYYPQKVEGNLGKVGFYLFGEDCWFEIEDGRSFWYPVDDFKLELLVLNYRELSEEVKSLISQCRKHKEFCSPYVMEMHRASYIDRGQTRKSKAKDLRRRNEMLSRLKSKVKQKSP